ncbi:MAG TPA: ABC transporter permease [Microbacteriaceae bacterium]|nr:ABC transporter permease [Microbacteriaceae bacterium]HWL02951.1 ABC transporter permease [Microbacteriaceae bacterium]
MKQTEAIPTVGTADVKAPNQWSRLFGFQNISAVYLFIVIFVIFAIWVPQTFLKPQTWANLLDTQSLVVLAALAVMVPLVTGVFNLAVGAEISFALMLSATLQQTSQDQPNLLLALGLPWWAAAIVVLIVAGLVGALSGLIVTKLKIDSFIATLGVASILAGIMYLVSQNKPLSITLDYKAVTDWYIDLGGFRLKLSVIVLVVVALIIWYILERTIVGRRMYASGFNPDGARLSGVNVDRLQFWSLVAGGVIAGVVGVLAASKFSGNSTIGGTMLIPALSAVFLGSTQFKGGRFNVWGTVVALYVLAVGVQGLLLVQVPDVLSDFFYGIALIGAVVLSRWGGGRRRFRAVRQATTFTKDGKAALIAEAEAEPSQFHPTETALKQDGIEDQGERP